MPVLAAGGLCLLWEGSRDCRARSSDSLVEADAESDVIKAIALQADGAGSRNSVKAMRGGDIVRLSVTSYGFFLVRLKS